MNREKIEDMKDISRWRRDEYIYRFAINLRQQYEIIILKACSNNENVADLYLTESETYNYFFLRRKLNDKPISVSECLELAANDYLGNLD